MPRFTRCRSGAPADPSQRRAYQVGRSLIPSLTFASTSASSRQAFDASQPMPQPCVHPWRSCWPRICRRPSALKGSRKTRGPPARVRGCRDPELTLGVTPTALRRVDGPGLAGSRGLSFDHWKGHYAHSRLHLTSQCRRGCQGSVPRRRCHVRTLTTSEGERCPTTRLGRERATGCGSI